MHILWDMLRETNNFRFPSFGGGGGEAEARVCRGGSGDILPRLILAARKWYF